MTTRNDELLDQVMAHIKAHPEQHDQGVWIEEETCGTTACSHVCDGITNAAANKSTTVFMFRHCIALRGVFG